MSVTPVVRGEDHDRRVPQASALERASDVADEVVKRWYVAFESVNNCISSQSMMAFRT